MTSSQNSSEKKGKAVKDETINLPTLDNACPASYLCFVRFSEHHCRLKRCILCFVQGQSSTPGIESDGSSEDEDAPPPPPDGDGDEEGESALD